MKINTKTGEEIEEIAHCPKCNKDIDKSWGCSFCPICSTKLIYTDKI